MSRRRRPIGRGSRWEAQATRWHRAMRGQKAAGREGQIEPLLVRAQERGKRSCRVKPLPAKAKERGIVMPRA